MKSFHKFYRSHSGELEKFGTMLMELWPLVWMHVLVEYIHLNSIYISDIYRYVRNCDYLFLSLFLRVHFVILFFACV